MKDNVIYFYFISPDPPVVLVRFHWKTPTRSRRDEQDFTMCIFFDVLVSASNLGDQQTLQTFKVGYQQKYKSFI